jgi:ADP-heptose:LPS heptosyltransferase
MKKIIGFNQGQIGDLAINMIPCKSIKNMFPDCHLIFSINKKYSSAVPIFYHNPLIDEIKIWDGYDNWPTEEDKKWINENKIDIFFNPMQPVRDNEWFLKRHHTEEVCLMHGISPPNDLQIKFNKYFDTFEKYKNCVAISPFTSAGSQRDIPYEIAEKIVNYIHSLGLETIQLGIQSHPQLPTTYKISGGTIFEDVKIALSCKFLITADTGINYLMSGYEHKVFGLYCYSCYPKRPPIKNRIPWNKNAIYLEDKNIIDIPLDLIYNTIVKLL